ncbi:hypothetical protein PENTCL1PPCAC_5886, partial [Pristionchus entomophagus]
PVNSATPTVTTEMIRDALFPGELRIPSAIIFNYTKDVLQDKPEPLNFEKKENNKSGLDKAAMSGLLLGLRYNLQKEAATEEGKKNEGLQKLAQQFEDGSQDEVITIRKESKPVIVGSIPYFWGHQHLPITRRDSDCFDLTAVNDPAN